MYFNTSFNNFGSISPSLSYKNSFKQNQNESFNSNDESRLKASISTHQYTRKIQDDNLFTFKLESKILQMQKKIDHQKYQIDNLTLETQTYMNLCEEQKKELNSFNIEMLKQEYQQQINQLAVEKEKLAQLIQNLTIQYQSVEMQQQNEVRCMKARNAELVKKIEAGMDRKQALLKQILLTDKIHEQSGKIMIQQEERIDSLRNIERKLFIALKQIESLNSSKS